MKYITLGIAMLLAIIAIPAYAAIPEEVGVGSVLPLTGGYSSVGVQVDAATALAVNDFNAYLEERGADWRFVLTREDSQSNPAAALEAVSTLHSQGIDIIFGPAASSRVQGVLEYADDNDMIILSCCSTAPSLAIPDDSVFRIVADDSNQGKALGKILHSAGIEAAIPIWIGDTYGDGLISVVRSDFEARGNVMHEGVRYSPDMTEYSASISSLADITHEYVGMYGADKVGIVIVAFDEIVPMLQTADNYPILKEVAWFGSETVADSVALKEDRTALSFAEDVNLVAVQVAIDRGDKSRYVAGSLGYEPNVFAYTGYDAVWLAGLSIIEANSANAGDIKDVIHDVAASYDGGATASTALNENGDLVKANYMLRTIQNGEWTSGLVYYSDTDTIPDIITEDVYVGLLLPLTGGYSSVGVQINAATALAVSDFNDYLDNKSAGWDMFMFQENTQSDPVEALERAQALHSRGVGILFGPAGSSRVQSVMEYVNSNNMILISCCSTAPSLAIPDDHVFRVVPDDSNQGRAFATVFEDAGLDVVVPIWIGDTYGDGLRDAGVSEFEARGGSYVEGVRYDPNTTEFSFTVSSLADIVQEQVDTYGADNVGIMIIAFDEVVSIIRAANTYPILNDVMWIGSETIAQSTAITRDETATRFVSEGASFSAIQAPMGTGPRAQYVADTLSIPFDGNPNVFTYNAYDAVWLIGMAIERGGSADASDIARMLPEVAASYEGALESTTLNENGDLKLANYGVWRLGDDGWYMHGIINAAENTVN